MKLHWLDRCRRSSNTRFHGDVVKWRIDKTIHPNESVPDDFPLREALIDHAWWKYECQMKPQNLNLFHLGSDLSGLHQTGLNPIYMQLHVISLKLRLIDRGAVVCSLQRLDGAWAR